MTRFCSCALARRSLQPQMAAGPKLFMLNRRLFLKRTALTAGAISSTSLLSAPNLLASSGRSDKVNCVQIGCGIRGMNHLDWVVNTSHENLVAIVDPDEKAHAKVKRWLQGKQQDPDKLQVFTDYRVMYDKIGKQIDAVFIATPNHHHAAAAMLAMHLNKGVYCEKPLCHDISEARK